MQKADKTNEISASAEQKLPIPPGGTAGTVLPARPSGSGNLKAGASKVEGAAQAQTHLTALDPPAVASPSSPANSTAQGIQSPQSASVVPPHPLKQTHDLMALHAFRLRDSGEHSLQVVIKPSPGLQLSLHLQSHGGSIQMQATLHHGDFNLLNQHWSELQQQLGQRGIRLAPLGGGAHTGTESNQHFHQPDRRHAGEGSTRTGAFAEFALNGALKPAPATKTRTLRGWESWA